MRTYTLKTKGPTAMVKLATRGAASGSNPQVAKMHGGYEVPPEANVGKDKELTAADFEAGGGGDNDNGAGEGAAAAGKRKQGEKGKNLFADSTVPSFFRRPTFSPDGELIIAPTGIYRHIPVPDVLLGGGDSTSRENHAAAIKSKFCTHVFSRHNLSTPLLSLTGLDEPSVAVRCSPVLYTPVVTPEEVASGSAAHSLIPGDYRVVFAVVTVHAVLVYDTQHPYPLAKVGGYHLATINDAAWSADGRLLTLCSSDGYLSFIRFNKGALGTPLAADKVPLAVKNAAPYLHKYTPPPYVEPEKKTKKTPAAAAAAAAAAASPSTPERIAQAITEQKSSGAATTSSSSSTDTAGKRKRSAPAPVTTATTGTASPANLVGASTSSASAEKVLSSIKAAPSATSAANDEVSNTGATTVDAAVAPDAAAAKSKKRRIAPMLVTNLAGVSAPSAGAVATAVKEGVATVPEETSTEAENAAN
jgi:chromatin assembly factor 1 subunit B